MMLAVSSVRSSTGADDGESDIVGCFSTVNGGVSRFMVDDRFVDSPENLLEEISFDDLFVGFDEVNGEILPDLEVDASEILQEISVSGDEDYGGRSAAVVVEGFDGAVDGYGDRQWEPILTSEKNDNLIISPSEETISKVVRNKKEERQARNVNGGGGDGSSSSSSNNGEKARKSSKPSLKASQGKRKVDWTPELHRRFVQAVEQLGVEKAVPSRILELMGIDCLTRHNIASHLQKYRSHRKHLLAREAEAASWGHRKHVYRSGGGWPAKKEMTPWLAATAPPTIGLPPLMQHFRPLHVWGHPPVTAQAMEPALLYVWPPRHVMPPPLSASAEPVSPVSPLPPPWAPNQNHLPSSSLYWQSHHYPRGSITQGTACYPQPMRFPPSVSVLPSLVPAHPVYRPSHTSLPPSCKQMTSPLLLLETHPPKESIDAAIGEVLEKPLLPLPLGLKPPSLEGVLVELQRQGIERVPPEATSCP